MSIRSSLVRMVITASAFTLFSGMSVAAPNAYIGNFKDNTVSVLDTAAGKIAATIPVATPHGMVISPDGGRLYVSSDGGSTISVIDTATNRVAQSVEVGKNPQGVAITPDGRLLLVAVNGEDRVVFVDTATRAIITTVSIAKPHTVSIRPDGTVAYVTSRNLAISRSLLSILLPRLTRSAASLSTSSRATLRSGMTAKPFILPRTA